MKALLVTRTGGPEVLQFVELPDPLPGPGEIRIRVSHASIVPFDVAIRSGRMTWNAPEPPYVMGTEFCGTIDQVGEGVTAWAIGDAVLCRKQWGGMAEYAVVPQDAATRVADGMDPVLNMVYLSTCATAWHAIHTAGRGLEPGQVLLLHSAAGPVSILAAQIAKEKGAMVIGLAGGPAKVDYALGFGFDHVIDYRAEADWPARVRELTGGKGSDLVIDGVQGPDVHKSLDALAPFGQIVFLGQSAGVGPPFPIGRLIGQSATVSGMVVHQALAKTKGREQAEIRRKISSGEWRYPLNPPLPFNLAIDAYIAFENRELSGRNVVAIEESPAAVGRDQE